jgi:hypothetical protein
MRAIVVSLTISIKSDAASDVWRTLAYDGEEWLREHRLAMEFLAAAASPALDATGLLL